MKIGIIGAMDAEISGILAHLEDKKEIKKAGLTVTEGRLGNQEVCVVKCGVGKVNAASCAQMLIDCFGVTSLINTGIAGSLNNDINIGDVVVSADAVTHDMDASVFGYPPGEIPGTGIRYIKADEELRRKVKDAITASSPEVAVFEGTVASGDQFISTRETKERIREIFHAECTEMEGAAIAQTAYLNGIPFVIVRFISDKVDESSVVEYAEFEKEAAERSAHIILTAVQNFS